MTLLQQKILINVWVVNIILCNSNYRQYTCSTFLGFGKNYSKLGANCSIISLSGNFGSMVTLNVRIIIGDNDTIKSGPVTGGKLRGSGTKVRQYTLYTHKYTHTIPVCLSVVRHCSFFISDITTLPPNANSVTSLILNATNKS